MNQARRQRQDATLGAPPLVMAPGSAVGCSESARFTNTVFGIDTHWRQPDQPHSITAVSSRYDYDLRTRCKPSSAIDESVQGLRRATTETQDAAGIRSPSSRARMLLDRPDTCP